MRQLWAFGLLLMVISVTQAEVFSAKVIAVIDGDTVLIIRPNHRPEKVRLLNIDAPEKSQPFGTEATQSLSAMVLKRQVKIEVKAEDHYGRLLGELAVDGRNVNEELVKRGMAWEYAGYNKNHHYVVLQNEAQQARRGLWRQTAPKPPWQWRKTHATTQVAPTHHGKKYSADTLFYDASCGSKTYCSQMQSCDEALYYLVRCGEVLLDKNDDGIPCENLCLGAK
jgi:endonuclease YncB( thermonuclease family)